MRLSVLSLFVSLGLGKVIEADDKSIDALLSNGIPTLLSLHAPWCGHCKTFGPQFEELSEKYLHAKDKIQFVKVDGDSNRKTAKKFDVTHFPTLKFIDADNKVEDVQRRDAKSLESLIKSKTKASAAVSAPKVVSGSKRDNVVHMSDGDLDQKVKDKHAIVAFTTTWCGHCKKLKPEWSVLADLYANDDDVIIGSVDCTEGAGDALSKRFGLKGYPTIIYFPKDGSDPFAYGGARSLQGVSDFLKKEGASLRESTGFLSNSAGVVEEFVAHASNLIGASESKVLEFTKLLESSTSEHAKQYLKYVPKVVEGGKKYIKNERKRLQGLIKGQVTPKTRDSLKVRMNILRTFLPSKDAKESKESKDEL